MFFPIWITPKTGSQLQPAIARSLLTTITKIKGEGRKVEGSDNQTEETRVLCV